MIRDEKIRHWLQVAQIAGEVMEFCMAQVARELSAPNVEGTVLVEMPEGIVGAEIEEPPTAPIRPPLG
jgi:hypothetical protein